MRVHSGAAVVCMLVVLAGCGGDASKTASPTSSTAQPPSSASSSSVTAAALPTTSLSASLDEPDSTITTTFDATKLGIEPGAIEANWYTSTDGVWVVFFKNLDLARNPVLCPGTSISPSNGFANWTNAETAAGACHRMWLGSYTLIAPPNGVLKCGTNVLYKTTIPATSTGTLEAFVEKFRADDTMDALRSHVTASVGAPMVNLTALDCKSLP